jgi:hypothetical protein
VSGWAGSRAWHRREREIVETDAIVVQVWAV